MPGQGLVERHTVLQDGVATRVPLTSRGTRGTDRLHIVRMGLDSAPLLLDEDAFRDTVCPLAPGLCLA